MRTKCDSLTGIVVSRNTGNILVRTGARHCRRGVPIPGFSTEELLNAANVHWVDCHLTSAIGLLNTTLSVSWLSPMQKELGVMTNVILDAGAHKVVRMVVTVMTADRDGEARRFGSGLEVVQEKLARQELVVKTLSNPCTFLHEGNIM